MYQICQILPNKLKKLSKFHQEFTNFVIYTLLLPFQILVIYAFCSAKSVSPKSQSLQQKKIAFYNSDLVL